MPTRRSQRRSESGPRRFAGPLRAFFGALPFAAVAAGAGFAQERAPGLTDVTEASGLRFLHDAGDRGRYSLPEITGAGGGFFDADGDGDLDIYLLQGGRPTDPPGAVAGAPGNALFLQGPSGRFADASGDSGAAHTGYGMGLAAADYDGDGRTDLFVTNYGPDALFRNLGEARFEDATASAGVGGEGWSSSAAFCDYDADGDLDLYVVRYVRNDPQKICTRQDGSQDYCSPQVFRGAHDYLYRNRGDRTFEEVSQEAGIRPVRAPGLGVVCADFDGDRRLDFYVANDGEANQLWLNQGDGTFVDDAFLAGVALNDAGNPEAGMGIALGDVDADDDLDLFITHVANQTNTLYRSDGADFGPAFSDRTGPSGLGSASMALTGFGTAFADLDLDGRLDLLVANGRVQWKPTLPGASGNDFWRPFAEPNQVFFNVGASAGDVRFEPAGAVGDFGAPLEVTRGLALGDYDDDGDLDVLVTNASGPARLFRNDFPAAGAPLRVRPVDAAGGAAFPVRVTATLASGDRILRRADPGGSYLATGDPRAFFAVPDGEPITRFEVIWPDGTPETFPGPGAGIREVTLRRGGGNPAPTGNGSGD